jgi:4-hydroxy-tetrahydrodipicolinate reductase
MIKIGVLGITGRTGRYIIPQVIKNKHTTVCAAIASPSSELSGKKLSSLYPDLDEKNGSLIISNDLEKNIHNLDVIIDFTTAESSIKAVTLCKKYKKKIVIATTGLNEDQLKFIKEASKKTAILYAENTSLGINNICALLKNIAEPFKHDADIDIEEAHHRYKKDSPSGTALKIARALYGNKEIKNTDIFFASNISNNNVRPKNTLGFSVRRSGNIVGEHSVIFTTDEETIEIKHKAHHRSVFAKGAVKAAEFIFKHDVGFFEMEDVLNTKNTQISNPSPVFS